MRGNRCSVGADLGDDPAVVDAGPRHTTVRCENAMVTFFGSRAQRLALLRALAAEDGMELVPAALDSVRIEAVS